MMEPGTPNQPDEGWTNEPLCNDRGWCWVEPTPFGETILDIHGTPNGETVFAVGRQGVIVESREGAYRYHDPGTTEELSSVRVLADDDVWVGGSKDLLHYDGASWSRVAFGPVQRITSNDAGRIWAVVRERIYELGAELVDISPNPEASYADVAPGAGPAELWALEAKAVGRGFDVVLHHFDGATWSQMPGQPPHDYSTPKLLSTGAEVYAYRRTGVWLASSGWESMTGWSTPEAAWAAPDGALFLAFLEGLTRIDDRSSTLVSSDQLRAIWGDAGNNLWIAPNSGGMVRVPARLARSKTASSESLRPPRDWSTSPWGTVPVDLWARSTAAWGSGPNDVWRASLEHFDGTEWRKLSDRTEIALDIDGSGPDDVWFVLSEAWYPDGAPTLLHWDGQALVEHVLPEDWRGFRATRVRSFGPTDVWIGANSVDTARLARFDGATWHIEHEVDAEPLIEHWVGIEGDSSRSMWLAATDALYHWHGGPTVKLRPAQDDTFRALSVSGPDVCVLGVQNIYCTDSNGDFVAEPYAKTTLPRVAFTGEYVWLFDGYDGRRVVRRAR